MLVCPHGSSAKFVLLAKAGTGLSRAWQLSSDQFGGGSSVVNHGQVPFVGKVVGNCVHVNGKSPGGRQQRTVAVIRYGRNEAHRKRSQVGHDQLP